MQRSLDSKLLKFQLAFCNDMSRGGICEHSLSRGIPLALQKGWHRGALCTTIYDDYYLTPAKKNVGLNDRCSQRIHCLAISYVYKGPYHKHVKA